MSRERLGTELPEIQRVPPLSLKYYDEEQHFFLYFLELYAVSMEQVLDAFFLSIAANLDNLAVGAAF